MTPIVVALLIAAAPVARTEKDVPFADVGGESLKLDVNVPAGTGPFPCVVCFHGGAWKYGSRKDTAGFAADLARNGYVGVTASYRLAPKHKWPAQIEDAKTAVRFLRANAAKFNLDPNRIAALGFSAGGHLSAMLGTADTTAGFDGKLYPDQSSRVQAVVDYFGPTDLMLYAESPGVEKAFFHSFLGKSSTADTGLYKLASPINHVTKDDPPFLILHGTADIIVPVIHSERLQEKLKDAGVPSELVTVSGGGHGWTGKDAMDTRNATLTFLKKSLGGGK